MLQKAKRKEYSFCCREAKGLKSFSEDGTFAVGFEGYIGRGERTPQDETKAERQDHRWQARERSGSCCRVSGECMRGRERQRLAQTHEGPGRLW